MDNDNAEEIIRRYLSGTASEKEQAWVESWYQELSGERKYALPDMDPDRTKGDILRVISKMKRESRPHRRLFRRTGWLNAAVLAVVCISGMFLYTLRHQDTPRTGTEHTAGGRNGGLYATFSDGTGAELDAEKKGIVRRGGNWTYLDSSSPDVRITPGAELVSLETPVGVQYQVVFVDGTEIWLNTASKITFGTSGAGSRNVRLSGEAFFDIAPVNAKQNTEAFIVHTDQQEVLVLGTAFNVCAYPGDRKIVTTLVSGKVRVMRKRNGPSIQSTELKAGFQAVSDTVNMWSQKADIPSATGWKDGDFVFNETPIAEILPQLERWYNVTSVYSGAVPTESFSGKLARNRSLPEVLRVLQMVSGVRLKLQDKRIVVNP